MVQSTTKGIWAEARITGGGGEVRRDEGNNHLIYTQITQMQGVFSLPRTPNEGSAPFIRSARQLKSEMALVRRNGKVVTRREALPLLHLAAA